MATSDIKSVEIFQPIGLALLPKGEYDGRWGGYEAVAIINGEQFRFRTVNGIRTMNAKCVICISEDIVTVRLKDNN